MILRGVNVDATNVAGAPAPTLLRAAGFNAIRLVNKGPAVEVYAATCRQAGIFVLDAITAEAGGKLLANADLHEIRNEIDIASASSEGIISPEDYKQQVVTYAGSNPGHRFVLGSLAAGDFTATYLRAVLPVLTDPALSNVVGFSLHPYAKDLPQTKALIAAHQQACRDVLGRDLAVYVTEWNRPLAEIAGYDWWLRTQTAGGWWFCWSEGMVPGFGLVKPELAQFKPFLATTAPSPAPDPTLILDRPTTNRWIGRTQGPPIALVIHTMDGSLVATDAWFANPASQVSAHYGIGLAGAIHQYVRLSDSAWANGIREPGNLWDSHGLPDVNPNQLTVSIETEDLGSATQPVTDAEYASTLAAARIARVAFPSIKYLLRHADISPSSRPNCPGGRWTTGRFGQLTRDLGLQALV